MKFEKGVSGNPTGRKRGVKNKNSKEIQQAFQCLLSENLEQMESDLEKLQPKERIQILLKLADFVLPKIQSVQSEVEGFDNEIIIRRV